MVKFKGQYRIKNGRPYSAKFLRLPDRKVEFTCGYCGDVGEKVSDSRYEVRFCSTICRDLWCLDEGSGPWARTRGPFSPLPATHPAMWYGKTCALGESGCHVCGLMFFHQAGQVRIYCSKRCANKARYVRGKAGHAGRRKIRRLAIFERDNYVCWMCEKACDPTLRVPHPLAPTIDHLTPQSLGGTHDEGNLATACFMCNSTRGASWIIPIPSVA